MDEQKVRQAYRKYSGEDDFDELSFEGISENLCQYFQESLPTEEAQKIIRFIRKETATRVNQTRGFSEI